MLEDPNQERVLVREVTLGGPTGLADLVCAPRLVACSESGYTKRIMSSSGRRRLSDSH